MANYTDDFTDEDGTTLPEHNNNWVNLKNTLTIKSNMASADAQPSQQFSVCYYNKDFNSKHYAKMRLASAANLGGVGPAIRCQANNNFYFCSPSFSKIYNGESINGNVSDWDSGLTFPALNTIVELAVDPDDETKIHYKENGSIIKTYTGKNALSGGKPGIAGWNNSTASAEQDDWEGGDVVSLDIAVKKFVFGG